jgi:hypothetical protein
LSRSANSEPRGAAPAMSGTSPGQGGVASSRPGSGSEPTTATSISAPVRRERHHGQCPLSHAQTFLFHSSRRISGHRLPFLSPRTTPPFAEDRALELDILRYKRAMLESLSERRTTTTYRIQHSLQQMNLSEACIAQPLKDGGCRAQHLPPPT